MVAGELTNNWTKSSIHCLERNLIYDGCINQRYCKTGNYAMKRVVFELFRKLGKPPQLQDWGTNMIKGK